MVIYWTIEFLINIWVTFGLKFTSMHVYKPHISTPWASFAPFTFGEWERSFGVKAQSIFFSTKEDLTQFWGKFVFQTKIFQVKTSLLFQELHFSFHFTFFQLISSNSNFSSLNTPWHQQTQPWLAFHSSFKTHENDFILDWKMFFHDLTWNF